MKAQQILFTETEGQALRRLMPALADARHDWEIVLVADTDAALELLSQRTVAIVIASFGTDHAGCERFLQEVQQRTPAAIRYALLPPQQQSHCTNFPETAHQCFPAQCTPAELGASIQRGLDVWQQASENPALANLLSDLNRIPTPPALYFEIREALSSQDSDAATIAEIIARDPAISAKILKVANSGFYALPRSVTDIHEAIIFMGTDTVSSLVLATHVFNRMPAPGINLDAMWEHNLMVTALARHIAAEEGGDRLTVNTAGVAGLLHDIGQLTLLSNIPEIYQSILRRAGDDESALLEMEREQFGVGHPELGSYILRLWSLPDAVTRAVELHHEWSGEDEHSTSLVTKAIYTAEWLLKEFSVCDQADQQSEHEYPFEILPGRIEDWRGLCEQLMR
jgi:putative nucleotidyltransferase with HDIG domain